MNDELKTPNPDSRIPTPDESLWADLVRAEADSQPTPGLFPKDFKQVFALNEDGSRTWYYREDEHERSLLAAWRSGARFERRRIHWLVAGAFACGLAAAGLAFLLVAEVWLH